MATIASLPLVRARMRSGSRKLGPQILQAVAPLSHGVTFELLADESDGRLTLAWAGGPGVEKVRARLGSELDRPGRSVSNTTILARSPHLMEVADSVRRAWVDVGRNTVVTEPHVRAKQVRESAVKLGYDRLPATLEDHQVCQAVLAFSAIDADQYEAFIVRNPQTVSLYVHLLADAFLTHGESVEAAVRG
jgi:hypothetical protein